MKRKPELLFVYYMEPEIVPHWKDGLWSALKLLEKKFRIEYWNLFEIDQNPPPTNYDFILGWGAWRSPADNFLHRVRLNNKEVPTGLCIGGNASAPYMMNDHSILFYETEWYKPTIEDHKNIKQAFGVNRDIYKQLKKDDFGVSEDVYLWDYLSVGSFSSWKRHEKMIGIDGNRLVIGQIQRNNLNESLSIIAPLLLDGVAVSDMVDPEKLNTIYNLSKTVYIPADINGGGERAVLEARSAGCKVLVENDNPKLLELLQSPIWDARYYADRLEEGIRSCLLDS